MVAGGAGVMGEQPIIVEHRYPRRLGCLSTLAVVFVFSAAAVYWRWSLVVLRGLVVVLALWIGAARAIRKRQT